MKTKPVHYARALNDRSGGVAALCFKRPRSLGLNRVTWTLRREAVTCPKCLAKLSPSAPR